MLAASPQLYYIHEPFNPDFRPGAGICDVNFGHHQTYITESNEKKYLRPIQHMISGRYNLAAGLLNSRSLKDLRKVREQKKAFDGYARKRMQPLIKDPIALMSAGWMARRFDINVLVMIRHPAAFVASMKRLNWGFDPTRWALKQKLLLRDYLSPLEEELRGLNEAGADIIDQAALLWKTAYLVVSKYKQQYPQWIYLRHEDISRDPISHYQILFDRLGLDFTDSVRERIREHSDESNPSHSSGIDKLTKLNSKNVISRWKQILSAQEIARIRRIAGEVSELFYSQSDWEPDNT